MSHNTTVNRNNRTRTLPVVPLSNTSNLPFKKRTNIVTNPLTNYNMTTRTHSDIGPLIRTDKAGNGTYGIVYIAETVKDKYQVVVKRNKIDTETDFAGSIKELDILSRLKGHPYIVNLLSVSIGSPFGDQPMSPIGESDLKEDLVHFIFEKAAYDGHALIYEMKPDFKMLKLAMVQFLLSVEYIHGKNVMHRDLKPSNLLWFTDTNTIKLCDFGLSKNHTTQGSQTPKVVTSWYRAPEICLEWPNYTNKSDMWSAGCVLFEMIAKKPLLRGSSDRNNDLVNRILSLLPTAVSAETITKMTKYRKITMTAAAQTFRRKNLEQSIGLSTRVILEFNRNGPGSFSEFVTVLSYLLVFDPDHRCNATQILNLKFFEGYQALISSIRAQHPPVPDPLPIAIIINCQERKWIIEVAYAIFNSRQHLSWYKHRVLFHAIDIFDRYLEYLATNCSITNGFHTRFETELRFMVCLYMSIKYLLTLNYPSSFKELVSEQFRTPQAIETAQSFELFLIQEIFNFKIYRPTVYEIADQYNHILSEENIRDLLLFYCSLDSTAGLTPRELYKLFLIQRGIPVSPIRIKVAQPAQPAQTAQTTPQPYQTYKFGQGFGPGSCRLKIVDRVDYYQSQPPPQQQ